VLVGEDGANLVMRSTPIAFVATGQYWVNNHAHILRMNDGLNSYWAAVIENLDISPLLLVLLNQNSQQKLLVT
jgi:type I restriction enzyme S subunit